MGSKTTLFKSKKGQIVEGLIVCVVGALILAGILNIIKPCVDFGFVYIGFLLLIVAIIFGVTGNLTIGTISGAGFLVFLYLSVTPCFPLLMSISDSLKSLA